MSRTAAQWIPVMHCDQLVTGPLLRPEPAGIRRNRLRRSASRPDRDRAHRHCCGRIEPHASGKARVATGHRKACCTRLCTAACTGPVRSNRFCLDSSEAKSNWSQCRIGIQKAAEFRLTINLRESAQNQAVCPIFVRFPSIGRTVGGGYVTRRVTYRDGGLPAVVRKCSWVGATNSAMRFVEP